MMRRSLIFSTVLDTVLRTAIVFSLYLLFTGHNAPGGGFIGGLVASAALVLAYVSGGSQELDRILPVPAEVVLGGGLVVAVGTGILGLVWGADYLQSAILDLTVPVLGKVKTTSALPFDIGVYFTVVGLALAVMRSLGAEAEK